MNMFMIREDQDKQQEQRLDNKRLENMVLLMTICNIIIRDSYIVMTII